MDHPVREHAVSEQRDRILERQQVFGKEAYKAFQRMPEVKGGDTDPHHVACYVRDGNCEGRIIEVAIYLRNDEIKSLSWAKSFGNEDECWMIARAISHALTSILFWGEIPNIAEYGRSIELWKRHTGKRKLDEMVSIKATSESLKVCTEGGFCLGGGSWAQKGADAHFYVEAAVKDWETVLINAGANYTKDVAGLELAKLPKAA